MTAASYDVASQTSVVVSTLGEEPLRSPVDGELYGRMILIDPADVRSVAETARAASGEIRRLEDRVLVLQRFAAGLEARRSRLEELLTYTVGKPIEQARAEVEEAIQGVRTQLELITRGPSSAERSLDGYRGMLEWEPRGVCGGIVPWNYPVVEATIKISTTLAAGCPVVIKVSPRAAAVTDTVIAAAIGAAPRGTVQSLVGGGDVGEALVDSVDQISFTGSTPIGTEIAIRAARRLVPTVLELGGKCVQIVLDRAALEHQIASIVAAPLENAGQNCLSPARIIVPEADLDLAYDLIAIALRDWRAADPREAGTVMGPVVDDLHASRMRSILADARRSGAPTSGADTGRDGAYVDPQVVKLTADSDWEWRAEEIFGPVLSVESFASVENALALAHSSGYGLGAVVRSSDPDESASLAARLDVGVVWIDDVSAIPWDWPLQARRRSGYGLQLGLEGIRQYQHAKQIWMETS